MKTLIIFLFISLPFLSLCDVCSSLNFVASSPSFTDANFQTLYSYFLQNLNVKGLGGVIASPDLKTPNIGGGNYSYHWMRDGSLSMRVYMEINDRSLSAIEANMEAYISWVLRVQSESDPFGIDVRIEPKFNLPYGDVFQGGWGRPQTDGPALRASTLMMYAKTLYENGRTDYISEYLWTGDEAKYNGGAIKFDLDWIVSNWDSTNGFDPWEDLEAQDIFWNRMHQRRAMVDAAQFATLMGDSSLASTYTSVAANIENAVLGHWNGNLFVETSTRVRDGAVICALNLGYAEDDFLKPTDQRIAQTVSALNSYFCSNYDINKQDSNNNVPGVLYGRYENDSYMGGNPWVLITANLASLFYRAAGYINEKKASGQVISDDEYAAWKSALNLASSSFLSADDRDNKMAESFVQAGDAVLQRLYYHVAGDNFHLAEQLDRNTGYQCSAKDLTWSYADTLMALKTRKNVVGSLRGGLIVE